MRGRSYCYSPSPPRHYARRGRSPSPRGCYGGCGQDLPTSVLVRNLCLDCRAEDLCRPFGQFGPLKDIYLLCGYYTGGKQKKNPQMRAREGRSPHRSRSTSPSYGHPPCSGRAHSRSRSYEPRSPSPDRRHHSK